jgi:hypothetical protein
MLEIDARVAFAQHRAARAQHRQSATQLTFRARDPRVLRGQNQGAARLPVHDPPTDPNGTFCAASITSDPLKEFVAVGEFLDSRHGGDVDRKS